MKLHALYWFTAVLHMLMLFSSVAGADSNAAERSRERAASDFPPPYADMQSHPNQGNQKLKGLPGYDCDKEFKANQPNGLYSLTVLQTPFLAYCEDGGIVIQRRLDGTVEFDRSWCDYTDGFGDLNKEHWLGLERIHQLTKNGNWKLKIDLTNQQGEVSYQVYDMFKVGDAASNYKLTLGGGTTGTAGNSLTPTAKLPDLDWDYKKLILHGQPFTTKNKDNDQFVDGNCAIDLGGQGWWQNACFAGNLNGKYSTPSFTWYTWKDTYRANLTQSTMRIMPRAC